eukprot:m.107562 g.107562  ORF g.107562 m.107562 type:complete len:410 (+) comp14253_c1_seq2:1234-2463(+)
MRDWSRVVTVVSTWCGMSIACSSASMWVQRPPARSFVKQRCVSLTIPSKCVRLGCSLSARRVLLLTWIMHAHEWRPTWPWSLSAARRQPRRKRSSRTKRLRHARQRSRKRKRSAPRVTRVKKVPQSEAAWHPGQEQWTPMNLTMMTVQTATTVRERVRETVRVRVKSKYRHGSTATTRPRPARVCLCPICSSLSMRLACAPSSRRTTRPRCASCASPAASQRGLHTLTLTMRRVRQGQWAWTASCWMAVPCLSAKTWTRRRHPGRASSASRPGWTPRPSLCPTFLLILLAPTSRPSLQSLARSRKPAWSPSARAHPRALPTLSTRRWLPHRVQSWRQTARPSRAAPSTWRSPSPLRAARRVVATTMPVTPMAPSTVAGHGQDKGRGRGRDRGSRRALVTNYGRGCGRRC